jgi:glucose/arabinose dehydrogenase/mono/diheme cytochrome c family protein
MWSIVLLPKNNKNPPVSFLLLFNCSIKFLLSLKKRFTMIKKMFRAHFIFVALPLLIIACRSSSEKENTSEEVEGFASPRKVISNPSSASLSPEESLKTFRIPKGYHLEVVASEPMIKDPVAIAWDGNARMYVAQMETYMQDVNGTGEQKPISRIMLLEDTNGDGKMDKSSVFIDKLQLPRMILCVGKELLVNETNSYTINAYKDTNGDGVADQKRTVYQSNAIDTKNLEHQRSGLDWNIDNWIYVTVDPVRFRYKNGMLQADSLVSGSNGQWGLSHDNYGRLFFSRGGAENAGAGFQINPVYGQLEFDDAYDDSTFGAVWPIIKTPDVQGGALRLRPDSTLNHFTAANGQTIFRGNQLPKSLQGDYLINEPVGRLIRRAKVHDKDGKITLTNACNQEEFIASSDMNFRPTNLYTGPDGCLYIVDMYRGIIQESEWTKEGSYLRPQIQRLGLDKNKGFGRIYRLVYDGMQPGPKPHMLDEPTAHLLTYLDHANGWWRDNAQKELVLRGDASVVPALNQIASGEKGPLKEKPSALGRLHALWTLDGLGATNKTVLLKAMDDEDAQVRKAAICISEPFIKNGDEEVINKLQKMEGDRSYDVRIQLLLSLNYAKGDKAKIVVKDLLAKNPKNELFTAIMSSLERNEATKTLGKQLGSLETADRKLVLNGRTIFQSLCASCHGSDGKGLPSKIAPPLVGDFRMMMAGKKDTVINIVLHGLTGPINGKKYPMDMPPMGSNNDEWIASVLSYLRFKLSIPQEYAGSIPEKYYGQILVRPQEVQRSRSSTTGRNKPWTIEELQKGGK